MHNLRGKAVLSINDHLAIRECFASLHVEVVPITYIVGGGSNGVHRNELVYSSWDRSAEPVGLF